MNNLTHRTLDASNTAVVLNEVTGKYEVVCLDTGEVIDEKNQIDLSKYRFSMEQAMRICQAIREGKTLMQIAEDSTFPSIHVISYWRKLNTQFDEEIRLARKQRAEYYHDKVLELANTISDDDNVAVAKFKADQYRWAAEKGDPSSYGNKIEHTGSNVAPSIIVYTGIDRRQPDVIEVINEQKNTSIDRQSVGDDGAEGVREELRAATIEEGRRDEETSSEGEV